MVVYKFLQQLPRKLIRGLENPNIPLINYILTFFCAISLRNFFESFSQGTNHLNLPTTYIHLELVHYTLSYILIAMLLILLLHALTRVAVEQIVRVLLPFFLLLLLTPLLDLLFSWGQGQDIRYYLPEDSVDLLRSYLSYAGHAKGITIGIKIEVLIVLMLCYAYCRIKGCNVLLSVFAIWAIYSAIFLVAIAPILIKQVLSFFNYSYQFSNELMIHFYLLMNFIFGLILVYCSNQKIVTMLYRDLRLSRLMFYELMLLLGVAIAFSQSTFDVSTQLRLYEETVINLLLAMISIFFASVFSIISNNIADLEIDKMNQPHRPLLMGQINRDHYNHIGYLCLGLSLLYAASVNARTLLLISAVIATYYLYSMPPIRAKRLPVFSKLVVGLSALIIVILGFSLVRDHVIGFPPILFLIFLLAVTLSAQVIDIKDMRGDRAAGIKTLPALVGIKAAKWIIACAFVGTYLSSYFLLNNPYLLPIIFALASIQLYLILRPQFSERWILIFNNFAIILLIAGLIIRKI